MAGGTDRIPEPAIPEHSIHGKSAPQAVLIPRPRSVGVQTTGILLGPGDPLP